MRIFPKSSSMRGLVNYILSRTSAHFATYELFKAFVLSEDVNRSIISKFNSTGKYFNTEYPLNTNWDILTPSDMFGGRYGSSFPVITSFDNYPKVSTIPDILNDKLNTKINILEGLPSEIVRVSETISSVVGISNNDTSKVKYWPKFKIAEYWPITNGINDEVQLNLTTTSGIYSIIRLSTGDEKYHHIDIEYDVISGNIPIIFIILDTKDAVDGDQLEFKINYINTSTDGIHIDKSPITVFLDGRYSDISIPLNESISSLDINKNDKVVISGITYEYVHNSDIPNGVSIPSEWDDVGYLISNNSNNSINTKHVGIAHDTIINGDSNGFIFNNYGFNSSEELWLNSNGGFILTSCPLFGESSLTASSNVEVNYSENKVELKCINGGSFHFGRSSNKTDYDLSLYTDSVYLNDIIVDTSYLPYELPKQIPDTLIKFTSNIESNIFYTFDIEFNLEDAYSISILGIQYTNITYNIRKKDSSIIIENGTKITTIDTTANNISIFFGVNRIRNNLYKKLIIVSGGSVLYEDMWTNCGDISGFDCSVLGDGSLFCEHLIKSNSGNNILTVSNIKILNNLSRSENESLFTSLYNDGTYNRYNSLSGFSLNQTYSVLRIKDISGYMHCSSALYTANSPITYSNNENLINPYVSNRVGFTYHVNKSNFRYRSINQFITNKLTLGNPWNEIRKGVKYYEYEVVASTGCVGIIKIIDGIETSYFTSIDRNNNQNIVSYNRAYVPSEISKIIDLSNIPRQEISPVQTPSSELVPDVKYNILTSGYVDSRVDNPSLSGWKLTTNYQLPIIF